MYLARDAISEKIKKNFNYFGRLCLYENLPIRSGGGWYSQKGKFIQLDDKLFQDLTWECEPLEVNITPH